MAYNIFRISRDLFYLAALFLGAGAGFIIHHFRTGTKRRFRNISLSIGFCLFSCAIAALTAAIICSNWIIFKEINLYLPAAIIAAIFALAVSFPRAAGFPLIIIVFIIAIASGFAIFSFPPLQKPSQILLIRDTGNVLNIMPVQNEDDKVNPQESGPDNSVAIIINENSVLEFRSYCFSFSGIFPLIGGIKRGGISGIMENNQTVYTNKDMRKKNFSGSQKDEEDRGKSFFNLFFSLEEFSYALSAKEQLPGTSRTVSFDGDSFSFR